MTLTAIAEAEAQERDRRYDQARASYRRARRQAPDRTSAAFASRKFALALVFWGEYGPARRELERTLEFDPADVASWHDLGMVCHRLGDYPAAERSFRRSIGLLPTDPRSRVALAALLWKTGRLVDARKEYQALLELELAPELRKKVVWAIETLARPADLEGRTNR